MAKLRIVEDVKVRSEFTGWRRAFEPYKNLSITITVFISTVALFSFLIYFGLFGTKYKLSNWTDNFISKGAALAYVNNDNNYDSRVFQESSFEFFDPASNYYNLIGKTFDNEESVNAALESAMIAYNSWKEVFINDNLLVNGQYVNATSFATNVGYVYNGANGLAYDSLNDAIASITNVNARFIYNNRAYNSRQDAILNYMADNNVVISQENMHKIAPYVMANGQPTGIGIDARWVDSPLEAKNLYRQQILNAEISSFKNFEPSDYTRADWENNVYGDNDYVRHQLEWLRLNPFIKQGPFFASTRYPTPADFDTKILANISNLRCVDNVPVNTADYIIDTSAFLNVVSTVTPPNIDCNGVANNNPPLNSVALQTFWATKGTTNAHLWNPQRPSVAADYNATDIAEIDFALWTTHENQVGRGRWNGNVYSDVFSAIGDMNTQIEAKLSANIIQSNLWTYKVNGVATNSTAFARDIIESRVNKIALLSIVDNSTYSPNPALDPHGWTGTGSYNEAYNFFSSKITRKVGDLDFVQNGLSVYTNLNSYNTTAFVARNFNNSSTDLFFTNISSLSRYIRDLTPTGFGLRTTVVNKTKFWLKIDKDNERRIYANSINELKTIWVKAINKK